MTAEATIAAPPVVTARALETARARLAATLAERAVAVGLDAVAVVPLGAADVADPQRDPYAALRPTAAVHLTAQAALIGPWGAGRGCGTCLGIRWQRLRTRSERDALEQGWTPRAIGSWPLLPEHAVDAIWTACLNTLNRSVPDRTRRVTRVDLETLRLHTVPLLPEPLCPHCGEPDQGFDELSTGLVSRAKPAPDAYRLRSPGSYQLPADALANPVCGVLGAATWLDVTSPTTAPVAGTVFMRGYAGLTDVTWSGQANSFEDSRRLAFLEGLERYAGTHRRVPGPSVIAAFDDLDDALDPRTCGEYAPETYAADSMTSPFDPKRPIPWVPGYSLRTGRRVHVPARLVYYSAGVQADNFVFECSNGCATGSVLEEAILFGLLELIERDAFLLGWYGGAELTEIDPASCPSPALAAMIDRAGLRGYDVHVFDNRIDLAIPVVTAVAVRRDGGPGTLAFAASAGFDPRTAVEGAVSEILTYIPHLPRQVAERPQELAAMAGDFDLVRRLPDHAALYGLPEMARHARRYLGRSDRGGTGIRSYDEVYAQWSRRRPDTGDLLDDVLLCRDEIAAAGHDVIVVDQTTPEQRRLGLRTVCTLAPGLLPIDFGWGRQRALRMDRLRTALRRGGLRDSDLADHEVHRVPHPFP
ncbi:protein of unknown function DUF181 [Catenulispora acidiphila DSM 44928]|uniref:YcaO domain-containing protein n=1 Tax=Catenulispora acidiphila (strain DSM 44928 / JCM 14897 / NBRC 102108 / NRRL B-24433 / ID139908) TaxID=479433 RepID=C7QBX9_CATAD|nr:TOMM precursor leader peptide-binding protein [Catenulispora acidiphila]ACU72598.1 protein of unknown function DUF181 [Catenulispora acidiphila DSM 44928]